MTHSVHEADLVAAARSGDCAALGQLLVLNQARLARHLAVRIPPSAARVLGADDIVQQTFVDAYRDFGNFEYRGAGSLFAWLRTIAQHRLQNFLRDLSATKRGGTRRQVQPAGERESSFALLVEELAGHDATASRLVSHDEAARAVRAAVAELRDDYRQVIHLRYFAGQNISQTALTMGRTPAAVRGLTERAKAELRAALGRQSLYMSSR